MSVNIFLHKTYRPYAAGRETILVEGDTVGACIEDLIEKYPDIETALFERKHELKKNIEIYVNMASAYPDELNCLVSDGDKIHITMMLTGG